MKKKLVLLTAVVLTLSIALAACSTSDSTQSVASDTQSSSTTTPVAASSSSASSSSSQDDVEEVYFDFDKYVYQYKNDNGLTDEQILADELVQEAMFEWLKDTGVSADLAIDDKILGCENVFLRDYIVWLSRWYNENEAERTKDGLDSYGIKEPQSDDFYDENGNFDKEGYIKAIDEYNKKVGEASNAHTDKVAEELGGETLTGEALDELNREADEFGEKVAEVIENGTVDAILDDVHNRLNGVG